MYITNNTINNTTNIQNITINNFGTENIKSLKKENILNCIDRCYSCIPLLFKMIHIDQPENRNLYLTSMKHSFLYTYQNNKWVLDDLTKILDIAKNTKKDIMEEYFYDNKDKFKKYKQRNIHKMLNDYEKGLLHNRYNRKLKMILYNNKNLLKKSYNKQL